ncbi:hypothetical protein G6O69_21495 [Pseudenhygromyxa sp. WMMC2535]|uniref:hypothetical protein n=1 Tax=Pseudenhygromyxa sp. WMMC2535 TaxID=2712867 RepID=UPI001557FD08|nr:hypothetical protein [Pseudenhygromyxa sp. WMMC2535]NVB40429.1 hypothetical protein [Pseudenhygromyxa sp. WMMC2535]
MARTADRTLTVICALALPLTAGCRPSDTASATPVEEDPVEDVQGPDAAESPSAQAQQEQDAAAQRRAEEQAKVEAAAQRITREVSAARELPITGEFAVQLIDKPGVRAFVHEVMYEEMTPEELQLVGRIDASMGVLPVGSDMEQVLLDMYELGVLGIYDPKRKTLLIGDYVGRMELGMVVGHEGAHGLQDMHFDLEALNHMHKGRSDLDTAQTFLIEGDAQAAYLAWVAGDEGLASIGDDLLQLQADAVLAIDDSMGIPHPILARQLQMPYTDGTMNVLRLARDRGWAAVDALYTELPHSSEQMLHLDKLAAREPPLPVSVDPQPLLDLAPGHRVAWEDELGEATLLAMLADVASPSVARAAAAGWGGDRFIALERETEPGPAPFLVGVIAWDSTADAKEFEALFRRYLETHKAQTHTLARKGKQVLFATHFAEAGGEAPLDAKAVERAGWAAFSVGTPRKSGKSARARNQPSSAPAAVLATTSRSTP